MRNHGEIQELPESVISPSRPNQFSPSTDDRPDTPDSLPSSANLKQDLEMWLDVWISCAGSPYQRIMIKYKSFQQPFIYNCLWAGWFSEASTKPRYMIANRFDEANCSPSPSTKNVRQPYEIPPIGQNPCSEKKPRITRRMPCSKTLLIDLDHLLR